MPELPAENRSALVIATGVYADAQLARLRAPARDAVDLAAVLGDPQLGRFEVTSLVDRPAHDIRVGVEDFLAERAAGDLVVVYLSCHGVRDAPGRLYFAAADTLKTRLPSTGVESQWLLDRLDECRARRQVLILDCCFSGAFSANSRKGEAEELQRLLIGHGRGRVVLTASRAGEYSYEGQALPGAEITGSVFTTGLVKGLHSGAADSDNDGLISVEDAYEYAYTYVQAHAAAQTPQRWTYGAEGKIWLARNPTSRFGPTAWPQPASQDPVARNVSDEPSTTRHGSDSHLTAIVGPSHVPSQMESRAALLARLATAMRASHDAAAARIHDVLSHRQRHLQHREASDRLTITVQPPRSRTPPLDGPQQPSRPVDPGIGSGAVPRPPTRRSAVRTATSVTASATCLLTVPVWSAATDEALHVGDLTSSQAMVQMTLCGVLVAALAIGVLLLVRNTAGRWLIAAGGIGLALLPGYAMFWTGWIGIGRDLQPLAAVMAASSASLAVLPSISAQRKRPR
ncbi:caspase family protein [Streptomyces sp. NPDC004232]|uniref:caspase family protein n=1 Tax=Streptomyces sp. NPDC004232 TaxID=3154454 RepID=UPI0033A5B2EE